MTAEAIHLRDADDMLITVGAAVASGEVWQMPNGKAGVLKGLKGASSGDRVVFSMKGQKTCIKASGVVFIDGCRLWWDHSANALTCVPQFADRDFYAGLAVGDAASADTTCTCDLNAQPSYIIDSQKDFGDTLRVLTAGTPDLFNRGGGLCARFSATAEAQKLDWLSKRSFPLASKWILEALVSIVETCDADVGDLSIGVANGTHESDADAITESAFFHYDLGADLNIDAESDDGTTEVAATDTTIDAVAGTPHFLCLDGRNPSNVKYYINGVEVLAATTNLGNIAVATGPLKALFHLEKSSNDSPGEVLCDIKVRTMQQSSAA